MAALRGAAGISEAKIYLLLETNFEYARQQPCTKYILQEVHQAAPGRDQVWNGRCLPIVPFSLSKDDRINNGLVLCSCWRELVARVYTFSTRAVRAASSH